MIRSRGPLGVLALLLLAPSESFSSASIPPPVHGPSSSPSAQKSDAATIAIAHQESDKPSIVPSAKVLDALRSHRWFIGQKGSVGRFVQWSGPGIDLAPQLWLDEETRRVNVLAGNLILRVETSSGRGDTLLTLHRTSTANFDVVPLFENVVRQGLLGDEESLRAVNAVKISLDWRSGTGTLQLVREKDGPEGEEKLDDFPLFGVRVPDAVDLPGFPASAAAADSAEDLAFLAHEALGAAVVATTTSSTTEEDSPVSQILEQLRSSSGYRLGDLFRFGKEGWMYERHARHATHSVGGRYALIQDDRIATGRRTKRQSHDVDALQRAFLGFLRKTFVEEYKARYSSEEVPVVEESKARYSSWCSGCWGFLRRKTKHPSHHAFFKESTDSLDTDNLQLKLSEADVQKALKEGLHFLKTLRKVADSARKDEKTVVLQVRTGDVINDQRTAISYLWEHQALWSNEYAAGLYVSPKAYYQSVWDWVLLGLTSSWETKSVWDSFFSFFSWETKEDIRAVRLLIKSNTYGGGECRQTDERSKEYLQKVKTFFEDKARDANLAVQITVELKVLGKGAPTAKAPVSGRTPTAPLTNSVWKTTSFAEDALAADLDVLAAIVEADALVVTSGGFNMSILELAQNVFALPGRSAWPEWMGTSSETWGQRHGLTKLAQKFAMVGQVGVRLSGEAAVGTAVGGPLQKAGDIFRRLVAKREEHKHSDAKFVASLTEIGAGLLSLSSNLVTAVEELNAKEMAGTSEYRYSGQLTSEEDLERQKALDLFYRAVWEVDAASFRDN